MAINEELITIENADIFWENFTGREKQFNPAGERNFCVAIGSDDAERLKEEGWNIKIKEARNPDDEVKNFIKVKIKYNDKYPKLSPNIYLIVNGRKNLLTEDTVSQLDHVDIQTVDVTIRAYHHEPMNGYPSTITAYVKDMYVVASMDALASKYAKYDNISDNDDFEALDEEVPF